MFDGVFAEVDELATVAGGEGLGLDGFGGGDGGNFIGGSHRTLLYIELDVGEGGIV